MARINDTELLAHYRKRFHARPPTLRESPDKAVRLIVIIPVHDEPDLIPCLESLENCRTPQGWTEILLVFNASPDDAEAIHQQNRATRLQAEKWIAAQTNSPHRYHLLDFPDLPPKHAGVGLARKLGMDEGAHRLAQAGHLHNGLLICYDADCSCSPNLLAAYAHHFEANPESVACSTHFEHPLQGPLPSRQYAAAAAYELHLRYYIEALRWARFPYALHTIGSSMAIRVRSYLRHGGMNRRKAGEDFYFLHKLMTHNRVTELTEATVYPSPRASHRVPFGTGRAIGQTLDGRPPVSYSFQAFRDLAAWMHVLQNLQQIPSPTGPLLRDSLPTSIATFLENQHVERVQCEILANTSSLEQYQRRLTQWFDGFRCMKFLNWVSREIYPEQPVLEAAGMNDLTRNMTPYPDSLPPNLFSLLDLYRVHQKNHPSGFPASAPAPATEHGNRSSLHGDGA